MGSKRESTADGPLRIVGYTRRSQDRPGGFGLEAQADAITRFAEYERAELVEIITDNDVSGVADPSAREGLSRALTMLRAGEADALVVAKFDRLARSLVSFAEVLKLSEAEGWSIVCLDPPLDLRKATGRAMGAMLIAFGDVEREAFADRMQGGRRAKIARGGYGGGPKEFRRYGSELTLQADGGYEYTPVVAEQATISRILDLRAEGESLAAIARLLEADGTAGPAGGRWHGTAIRRIAERVAA